MSTYLITGTGRGLGLNLVSVLASQSRDRVAHIYATTRSTSPSPALSALISAHPGAITHIALDLTDTSSIKSAASGLEQRLPASTGIDYLILNAAVRDPSWIPIESMDFLREALATNVVGTHETIVALLPLLRRGKDKKIVMFSSTLGCITQAQVDAHMASVGFPAYKISKAGTHMLMAQWSNRLKGEGFCVYMQSPGNLKTELAGGETADLDIEVGAKEVVRIAQEAKPEETGRHRNILVKGWENGGGVGGRYDGEDLFW